MPAVSKVQLCAVDKKPPNDESAIATLRDLFGRQQKALSEIAARHLTPERLAKLAINCVSKNPRLLECTPISIVQSSMAGAAMGLEAGGPLGEGYLIPRWNSKKGVDECQFLPGYKGLISLARRSGHVLSIEADVVYDADVWEYSKTEMGTNFTHVPSETDKPGNVRLAYAVARLKDTPLPVVVVMYRREIEAIRTREKKRGDSPWDTDYAEMCKKTSIRRICKYMPMSIELAGVLDSEAEDDDRDAIDVTPKTVKRLKAPDAEAKVDEAPEISDPHVDESVSQELPEIEPIGDVLAGIAALRTSAECSAHSERMKVARWENEDDRKAAVDMFKVRWKAVLAEEKAAMKAATTAPGKAKKADESATPDWAQKDERDHSAVGNAEIPDAKPAPMVRCDECGQLKGHDTKCSKNPANVDTRTIDWVKENEQKPETKLMGLKEPPPGCQAIRLSDGSYADTREPEKDGDEIQGREPGSDDD